MTIHFSELTDRDVGEAKMFAASRKLKTRLRDATIDVHEADWRTLHSISSSCIKAAEELRELIQADTDTAEVREIERMFDTFMALHDGAQSEMDRRGAAGQRDPLPNNRPQNNGEVRGSGSLTITRNVWRDERGEEIRVLAPNEPLATERTDGLGVGEITRAMILGPKTELERRALAEGTDSAGGYTVPEVLSREFIDKLRAQAVVFQAGARTVEMTSDNLNIARLASDPTVQWLAENAQVTASDPTFESVRLAPKKLMAMVRVSRELLEDSVNVGPLLENAFVQALSLEFDRAALFGSGSSNEPTGLFNISGINSVSMGTNGATPSSYDDLIDSIYEVQLDNGDAPKVFIMHPRTNRTYAKLKDANNNPLTEPKMTAEVRRLLTTAVPINQTQGTATSQCSTVLTGDFSRMLVGMRSQISLRQLDQPYADYDQVVFIARMRADVAVTHPVHFCKLIGIKP